MLSFLVVAVLTYAPPSGNAGAEVVPVSQAIKRALRQNGITVVDGALERARRELERGWVDESELAFFARARQKLADGRYALERVELDRAESLFADAERLTEAQLVRPGAAELFAEAALAHGIAQFLLGREEPALHSFQRAATLDPSAQLTESSVRPDVARAFARAVASRDKKRLRITARPVEASIRIDGRPLGTAPAQIDVEPGEHLIVVRASGFLPRAELAVVGESGLATELALAPDPAAEALERLRERPESSGAAELERLAGVEGVVVVAAGLDQGRLTLVGQRLGASGCASPIETTAAEPNRSPEAAALALVSRLGGARLACPPDAVPDASEVAAATPIVHPRPAPKPPKPKPRFYQQPWLWLGLLAVASAAVGTAIALVPQHPSFSAAADTCKFGATCH